MSNNDTDRNMKLDQEKLIREKMFEDYNGKKVIHSVITIGNHPQETILKLSKHQLIYSILGLVLGLVCIIGGIILFLFGITGKMSWTAKFIGASSEILDAAPGAVLFIVGLFIVFVTRYKFKSKR